jgi:hypothetical protein
MSNFLPVGPYKTIKVSETAEAPWYMLSFNKLGHCEAPLTRQHIVDSVYREKYTDIFIFSHGWNNDWAAARARYDDFLAGFQQLRSHLGLAFPPTYRPLLIGVIWPSSSLVFPWERAPLFAGGTVIDSGERDSLIAEEQQVIRELAAELPEQNLSRFYSLAQSGGQLNLEQARELANILSPIYRARYEELPGVEAEPTEDDLLRLWASTGSEMEESGEGGFATDDLPSVNAAGSLSFLAPRQVFRLATVWQMKDRAGAVGTYGVGPLLRDLLSAENNQCHVHLIGHSFGAKVLLSATASGGLAHKVNSMLLLQPAVNHLCFAKDATGEGEPGGYYSILERIEQPIMTTFSDRDGALHDFFHLAVRRAADIGERRIAGAPPSRYSALGGYGPGGADEITTVVEMKRPEDGPYKDLSSDQIRIIALRAHSLIRGHGDISNEATWWALHNQVAANYTQQ